MWEPITLNLSPQYAVPEREPSQFSALLIKWLLRADACFLKLKPHFHFFSLRSYSLLFSLTFALYPLFPLLLSLAL